MLAAKGPFYVIRFDNRDTGLSTKLSVPSPWMFLLALPQWIAFYLRERLPYTLEDLADDAVALITALGIPRAHFVGTSMGGMIAQLVAIRHPDRCLSMTSMSSTTGCRGLQDTPFWMQLQFMKWPKSDSKEDIVNFGVNMMKNTCCYGAPFDEEFIRKDIQRSYERMIYPHALTRHAAAVMRQQDREPMLRNLQIPALVIHGEADLLVPYVRGERTARVIPGAKLLTLPNTAHYLFPWHFDIVTSAIADLAKRCTN